MASVAQRFLECGVASPERRCVQLELPVASREPGREARSHELQHPPNVLRGHELPGPAQRVRPKDGALRDGALDDGVRRALGQTEPERPLRGSVVLGLDRPVPLQLDMTNEDDAANRMSERYGVSELPTVLAGSRRVTGFVRPAEMLAVLRQC